MSRGRLSLEKGDVAVSESEMKVTLKRKIGMPLLDVPELNVPGMGLPGGRGELAARFIKARFASG